MHEVCPPEPPTRPARPAAGGDRLEPETAARLARAREIAASLGSAAVAFSGGVDSALALALCTEALGARCVAVTGRSDSLAPEELEEARGLAAALGVRLILVDTEEITLRGYRDNPPTRCFACKTELYRKAKEVAAREGIEVLVDGVIADDAAGGDRPGLRAGELAGVRSILAEAGMRKADVRAAARLLGLSVWDKPAMACLSSRIPFGEAITPAKLAQIAKAESALRRLGFRGARVRYHGALARIELLGEDLERAVVQRAAVLSGIKAAGFTRVTLDLEGYRTGGAAAP